MMQGTELGATEKGRQRIPSRETAGFSMGLCSPEKTGYYDCRRALDDTAKILKESWVRANTLCVYKTRKQQQ